MSLGAFTAHTSILVLLLLVVRHINGSTPLPSVIYQPGAGIVIDAWRMSRAYSLQQFSDIPDYPHCPHVVQNSNTFEYSALHRHQHIRARAYFVSTQTGEHKFFAICNNFAQLKIEHLPNAWKTIIDIQSTTADNWSQRKTSEAINLIKGFRYQIVLLFYGNGQNPDFFRLGVQFPDLTEVKPLDTNYLRRSMEFYEWKGLLAQRYEPITYPSSPETFGGFKALNTANYPSNPSYFTCRSTLYDPEQYHDYGNYYALRYIGYFRPATQGTYKFKMWCNEICEFNITKNGVETSLGEFTIVDYDNPQNVLMDGGALTQNTDYPIKAFMTERAGKDYIRIMYQVGGGSFETSWTDKIRNLLPSETSCVVPPPTPAVVSSTSISVSLTTLPTIPPRDQWTSDPKYDVVYHKKGSQVPQYSMSLTGNLTQTGMASGLSKYTEYEFYSRYYGKISGTIEHNVMSTKVVLRTGEDVPDQPPQSITISTRTSTSIKLIWGLLPGLSSWNGIPLGYQIKYAVKDANPKTYSYVNTTGSGNRQNTMTPLLKYTDYEFQVAGRTAPGVGVFTAVIEAKTKEDSPDAPPMNVTAHNTSSSSISVQWKDVEPEYRSGIITGFKVYTRKSPSSASWDVASLPASQKSYVKSGLELWTFYDVKVSAETSVGEGPKSVEIKVRTDEDTPTGPPTSLATSAVSSTAIKVDWADIATGQTNGIITSYQVNCQRTDKLDAVRSSFAINQTTTLEGLEEYVDYDISVAGMTQKGVGVFTSVQVMKTLEDAPSAGAAAVRGQNISSTAIRIYWDQVPVGDRNGIITGYNISYRSSKSTDEWQTHLVSTSPLSFTASGLEKYHLYEFKIAGITVIGMGPFSSLVDIRTDADGPTAPPANLTGHFINHTSLTVSWTYIPEGYRQGIVKGYKLMYRDETIANSSWISHIISSEEDVNGFFNKTLVNLKIYTPYQFKVAGFTVKAVGVFSDNVTVWTDDFFPQEPPKDTNYTVASSTEIILNWKSMAEVHGDANGKILGYIIRYQVVDCGRDRPIGCNESEVFTLKTTSPNSTVIIPNLRKFTQYRISVKVYNRKGEGNFSAPVVAKTAEDTPDAPPSIVETWPGTTDSIKIFWNPIPESKRSGIILSYRIFYKPLDVPLHKYNRAPRSVNQYAAYGALPGEKMLVVNATTYQVEIADLKFYSWYQVRIGAVTSQGLGVTFSINGTCKQGTPIDAPDLQITDMYDFYEISLKWNAMKNDSATRGEVLGYRIRYWPILRNEFPVLPINVSFANVREPNRSLVIKNLTPYTTYGIAISAYTEGGFGVFSKHKLAETCRCPKVLYSSRMLQPPLVDGFDVATGILPKYIDEAVQSCCGNCTGGHGGTSINWKKDKSNSHSVKYDMHSVMESLVAGTQIAAPVFRDSKYDNPHALIAYVPFVDSPGVAIFQRKPTKREMGNKGAAILSESIFSQFPSIVLLVLFCIVAGIIYWFLEKDTNTAEIPPAFIEGTGKGFWLAYITATTVGYGDVTPVTKLARIFTLFWSLTGIILVGRIVGGISESLSNEVLHPTHTFNMDGKILASNETFMVVIKHMKKRALIGNTSDPYFIRRSLLSADIAGAVIDVLKAAQYRKVLEHPDVDFIRLLDIDASYGVALAGEGKRIKRCMARYAQENAQNILMELSNYSLAFQAPSSNNLGLLDYMISEHADLTRWTTKYSGIVLAIFVCLGLAYEFTKWIRGRAKVGDYMTENDQILQDLTTNIEDMVDKIEDMIDKLDTKHAKERLQLSTKGMSYVTQLYPDLSMFDNSIPSQNKYASTNSGRHLVDQMEEEEEEAEYMPMDYKSSWVKLR